MCSWGWYFTNIIISQLLKKPEKGEEPTTEKPKERGEETDIGDGKLETCASCTVVKARSLESSLEELREKWASFHSYHTWASSCRGVPVAVQACRVLQDMCMRVCFSAVMGGTQETPGSPALSAADHGCCLGHFPLLLRCPLLGSGSCIFSLWGPYFQSFPPLWFLSVCHEMPV